MKGYIKTMETMYHNVFKEREKQMPIIMLQTRVEYGNVRYYPTCEQGKEFLKLTGTKTLTREQLCSIRKLGFTFEQVPAEIIHMHVGD
jgi:hypothetical protein